MFTGIIEELGEIKNVKKNSDSSILTIKAKKVLEDTIIGDSISVNGVCLTVNRIDKDTFTSDIMSETIKRSTLGIIKPPDKVNLERAIKLNGRFGGHIVTGHIDGTGEIISIEKSTNSLWYTIKTYDKILKYIIEKGSIALDGISLTVAYVEKDSFKVSIIPHTEKGTILFDKKVGELVNLECDIIGKYIERLMSLKGEDIKEKKSDLSIDFLSKNGFI